MTKTQIFGYILIGIALLLLIVVGYTNSQRTKVPLVFSEKDMLTTLWGKYKDNYIEANSHRTLDKQQNNITTSEGESYTMLRAVWMDDKQTFDDAYGWTTNYLKRKEDSLHAWKYGDQGSGKYGVLIAQGGYNSATDADTDMAMALIFAANRWQQQSYLDDAKKLVSDIYTNDVVVIKGVPYMTSNNLEKTSSQNPILNVSYFAPYAYRMFAKIDPTHNWNAVIDSSYAVLEKSTSSNLNKGMSAHLPPDWVVINRSTGAIEAAPDNGLTTNFSYDALRTPWRIAMDYQWFKDSRAKQYLDQLSFLSNEWQKNGKIASTYAHDGAVIAPAEAPAMYGGTIGYFIVSDPSNAAQVYEQKLKFLFNPDLNEWKHPLGYYDENWAWFGIGLYNNLLPNLSRN